MKKTKKDTTVLIRLPSLCKEKLAKEGITIQNIVDEYLMKKFDIRLGTREKK